MKVKRLCIVTRMIQLKILFKSAQDESGMENDGRRNPLMLSTNIKKTIPGLYMISMWFL